MRRRLLHIGICVALLSVGWGGALAVAVCRHAGGDAEASRADADASGLPACCRTEAGAESSHCPMPPESSDAAPHREAAGDEHDGKSHDSHRAAGESGAARAPTASAADATGRTGLHARTAFDPTDPCAHCVGRPERPSSSVGGGASRAARRADADGATQSTAPLAQPSASFARPVAPSQHAPPRADARRHLTLNVFLI